MQKTKGGVMMVPTLSVVMTNYNYSQYIEKAVITILEQSYTPLEFIIIDDASTDDSVSKIERLFANKSYCKLIRHNENKGILYTLQEALQISKGTHIYHASSDDYVEPEFFKKSMELIEKNPTMGLCCGKPIYFHDERSLRIHHYLGVKEETQIIYPEELASLFRKSHFSIAGVTSIFRRDLMLKYGGYQPNLKSACDGFLIHQIAFRHPIGYIPEPFAAVRVHSSSYSARVNQAKKTRRKVFAELMQSLNREELSVIDLFKKSGMLLYFGKPFVFFLFCHPKYWKFLPAIIGKQIAHKKLKLLFRLGYIQTTSKIGF
jgi:glycosyltransferase involved in cell wall biosynthesis